MLLGEIQGCVIKKEELGEEETGTMGALAYACRARKNGMEDGPA
jgi:hypothetical protein